MFKTMLKKLIGALMDVAIWAGVGATFGATAVKLIEYGLGQTWITWGGAFAVWFGAGLCFKSVVHMLFNGPTDKNEKFGGVS